MDFFFLIFLTSATVILIYLLCNHSYRCESPIKRKTNGARCCRIVVMKTLKLIQLYCAVCHHYNNTIAAEVQRLSNNFCPKFTDEECITIYLFGIAEGKFVVKDVYNFIKEYYDDWFPALPSYKKFCKRINFLAPAFQLLFCLLISENILDENHIDHIMDSMPIIVANEQRSGSAKAAKGLCNKGFCSSKKMYFYGVKMHVLGQKQYKTLPKTCMTRIEPASENDITVAKDLLRTVRNINIFADKIYADKDWFEELSLQNINIFTPVKKKKGQEFLDAADALLSSAISRARQAIESFFNWIQEKTRIQTASKVRSDNGLISFIFARLAMLAFFYW